MTKQLRTKMADDIEEGDAADRVQNSYLWKQIDFDRLIDTFCAPANKDGDTYALEGSARPSLDGMETIELGRGQTQTFSVELQTCHLTDEGIERRVVKIDHVLSYLCRCICSKCGRGFPGATLLKLHMEHHPVDIDKLSQLTANRSGTSKVDSMENPSTTDEPANYEQQNEKSINKHSINKTNTVDVTRNTPSHRLKSARIQARKAALSTQDRRPKAAKLSLSNYKQERKSVGPSSQTLAISSKIMCTGNGKTKHGRPKKEEQDSTNSATIGSIEKRPTLLTKSSDVGGYNNPEQVPSVDVLDHAYYKHEVDNGAFDGGDVNDLDGTPGDPNDYQLPDDDVDISSDPKSATTTLACARNESLSEKSAEVSEESPENPNGAEIKTKPSKIKEENQPMVPLECDICGETFKAGKRKFLDHQNIHAGLKPYVCTVCNEAFSVKEQLWEHARSHKHFQCEVCGKYCKSVSAMSDHMNIHTGTRPHQCTICSKQFKRKTALTRHMHAHTSEKPYACSVCGKRFSLKTTLSNHISIHGKRTPVPFECDICGEIFRASCKRKFLDHQNIHTGVKPYVCSVCNDAFPVKGQLWEHIRNHKVDKRFQCEICGKYCKSVSAMGDHMNIHTGARPHQCTVCGKQYKRKTALSEHMRAHTGEKPYACSVCGKRFSQKTSLNNHITIHNDERMLCPHCGKTFKQRGVLRQHVKSLHIDKPEACTICGKVFKEQSYLLKHYKTHNKPHSCPVCGRLFARRYKMVNHWRKHTGEPSVKCTSCNLGFGNLDALYEHIAKTHGEENLLQGQSDDIETGKVVHSDDIGTSTVQHVDGTEIDGTETGSVINLDGIGTGTVLHLDSDANPDTNWNSNVIIFIGDVEIAEAVRTVEDAADT